MPVKTCINLPRSNKQVKTVKCSGNMLGNHKSNNHGNGKEPTTKQIQILSNIRKKWPLDAHQNQPHFQKNSVRLKPISSLYATTISHREPNNDESEQIVESFRFHRQVEEGRSQHNHKSSCLVLHQAIKYNQKLSYYMTICQEAMVSLPSHGNCHLVNFRQSCYEA